MLPSVIILPDKSLPAATHLSSPFHYRFHRSAPTTPQEKALIGETLVAYHEEGLFEVWYYYPDGFVCGRAHGKEVFLTDPTETVPDGFVADQDKRYFARTDRELAGMVRSHVKEYFTWLYSAPPIGILVIPGFVAPNAPVIPSVCPDPDTLPRNWGFVKK